jgi:hypothetical protein
VKAERAIVVDFKAFPFSDELMVEWLRRLKAVSGRSDLALGYGAYIELAEAYNGQSPANLQSVARIYEADFVVAPKGLGLSWEAVYVSGGWAVYKVPQ